MIRLLADELHEIVALINVVTCINLGLFSTVRVLTRYRIIANKYEYISFICLSLSMSIWSVSFLITNLEIAYFFKWSGLLLCVVFLVMYFLSSNQFVFSDIKSSYIITIVLLAFSGFLLLIIPHPLLNSWHRELFLNIFILISLVLNLNLVYYFPRESSDGLYRLFRITLATWIVLLIFDAVTRLYPGLATSNLSIWATSVLILLIGSKALDREYYNTTQSLNQQITAVKEEYEAEVENIEDVVISLARTIDAKDKYTEGHTERVSQLAVFLGERLGMNEKELERLRIGALIHDIGKIGINLNILNKPGALSAEERQQIQQHPELGEQICSPLKALASVQDIIRHHHEKLDGSGYPDGLKGEEISFEVRIVTVADIFDALTTERAYRKALPVEQAMRIIKEEAREGKLDMAIVTEFEAMLKEIGALL